MIQPADLARLVALLDPRDGLDSFGLLFFRVPGPSGYEQTSDGCLTFASTGGDGVHFSLLDLGDGVDNSSPVVMTVPMAERPNRLVGRNLRHFLALGLGSGYFVLEQLQYDFPGTCSALQEEAWCSGLSDEEIEALGAIAEEFGLTPWDDYPATFAALEAEWGDRLA